MEELMNPVVEETVEETVAEEIVEEAVAEEAVEETATEKKSAAKRTSKKKADKKGVVESTDNEAPLNEVAAEKRSAHPGAASITKLGASLDDGNDLITAEMPVANQRAEIAQMERAIRKGEVCYGRVIGAEVGEHNKLNMVVKRDTLRVVIPAADFFAHSYMKEIDEETEENKFIRYRRKASHMFGAAVSFLPKALGYNESGVPFVAASRKEAMDKLQEKHFFSSRADVKEGAIAKASIISAGPRYVTVECLGVESIIGTGGLSAFSYIEDASKEFRVGEGLIVAVEKVNVDRESRKVSVDFSHALVERLEAKVETASDRMLNGRYLATVVAVLKEYYVVIITGLKIRGLIPINAYAGTESLIVGDSVVMLVTGVNEERNLVIGRCMRTN